MKLLTMLVTSDGQWVVADSAEFRAALGDPDPDYDGAAFAVKNLGFIKFQILDGSVIEIELHPHTVELPALLAVQQQLLTSNVRLFRIKYFTTSWKSEILPASDLAVSRLSELCAPKFAPASKERFIVEPQDYSRLYTVGESPLTHLVQKWRMSFAHFDPSVISFAIKQQLLSRMIIVGVRARNSDPIFRFIGDGHANWLDDNYHLHAIGEKIDSQPDKDYGGWVAEFYKSVASTGQPRYDYVTAAIQRGHGAYVTRYERLLLPWKTPSNEVLVTLSSRGLSEDVVVSPTFPEPESSVSRNSAISS